jgi:hypothetical protein
MLGFIPPMPTPRSCLFMTKTRSSDHAGSDGAFGANIDIVAHVNTKRNMATMDEFRGADAQFLPKRTFTDRMVLGSGTDEIDFHYFRRGHTDGDAWVVFPAVRAMHAGDMFSRSYMPLADAPRANGSATESASTLTNDTTPRHRGAAGPPSAASTCARCR